MARTNISDIIGDGGGFLFVQTRAVRDPQDGDYSSTPDPGPSRAPEIIQIF